MGTGGFDISNQLVRVINNGNQISEYTYNGAGQRIKKVTQTETRIFQYDLKGHLIAETSQTGQMLAEYFYLGDQLLGMIKPGEAVYYFHNDHLGTPQVLIDDTQTIAWKAVYTPFGEAVASIQTIENPFRFPGQYYDSETGLHYNYFRYYNPQTGRYITPDPIGLEGGINLFAYVASNPASRIDPKGLDFSTAIAMQMPRLIPLWAAALAEPTPVGEAVAGVVTAYLVAKNLEAFSDTASISVYEYELLSMTGPVFATDAQSLDQVRKKIEDEARKRLSETKCETREPWEGPPQKHNPNDPPGPDEPLWKLIVWAIGQAFRMIGRK